MKKYILLCLFIIGLSSLSQAQKERIISFNSDIEVNKDRSLDITEYITVFASGSQIKRGIKIAYPTRRTLGSHGKVNLRYNIQEVRKDGIEEPYHTEKNNNQLILFLGSKNVFLKPGVYEYVIKYSVKNQIAFFDYLDELYWNPIGSYSDFSIDKANTKITFPEGVEFIQEKAYVGSMGETGSEYTVTKKENVIEYTLTRALAPREGYSIGIGVEKGLFDEPGIFQMYGLLLTFITSILTLFGYFIYTWMRYGRDPATPPSYPVYSAPDGLSPAALSYLFHEQNKSTAVTASMISLVNKGYITIEKTGKTTIWKTSEQYILTNLCKDYDGLPEEQRYIMEELFADTDSINIDGKYQAKVGRMHSRHQNSIREDHSKFVNAGNNAKRLIFPFLFIIAAAVIMAVLFFKTSYSLVINPLFIALFAFLGIVFTGIYAYLIKKPTVEKLELQSRIRGFRMYMSMTEKERMNILNPPEKTIGHFEEMLPFAFALGVDHMWSSIFAKILKEASYFENSNYGFYNDSNFSKSFTRSVQSSSTAPSSSGGGSGGGGSSGGGGGGGSVGGW